MGAIETCGERSRTIAACGHRQQQKRKVCPSAGSGRALRRLTLSEAEGQPTKVGFGYLLMQPALTVACPGRCAGQGPGFLTVVVSHWAVAVVLAGFLLLGLTYSLTTPIFEAPDELYHFEYARHVARTGNLPDMRAAVRPWAQEGAQPPLYYLTVAVALRTLAPATWDAPLRLNPHARIGLPEGHENKNRVVHTADERFPFRGLARAVHVARLASLAWAGLGVAGTYALGWLTLGRLSCDTPICRDDPSVAVPLAVALVAALPQFAFISGAISNDPAIMATTAWALTALWYAGQRAPSPRLGGLVGLMVGLATLCKLSGLLMAVFGLAVLMVSWRSWARERCYWAGLRYHGCTGGRLVVCPQPGFVR